MAILSHRWGKRKPQSGYGIDPSHPLAKDLALATTFNDSINPTDYSAYRQTVATGLTPTELSPPALTPSFYGGTAGNFAGGALEYNIGKKATGRITAGNSIFSCAVVFTASSDFQALTEFGARIDTNDKVGLYTDSGGIFKQAGGADITLGQANSVNGNKYMIALSQRSATSRISCLNGKIVANATNNGTSSIGSTNPFVVGTFYANAIRTTGADNVGLIDAVYWWYRPLTAAELISLWHVPFDMFMPFRRRLFNAGSAAVSVALTGSSITASAGSVSVSVSVSLAGTGLTSSAGTLTPNTLAPLAGSNSTASAGSVAVTVAPTLTGSSLTSSAGSLSPSVSTSLAGSGSTATPGSVSPAASVSLAGSSATSAAGLVSPSYVASLIGSSSTVSPGSLSPTTDKGLLGSGTTATPGNATPTISVSISGSSSTSSPGTFIPGTDVALVGIALTISAGTVTATTTGQTVTVALTGIGITAYAGFVIANGTPVIGPPCPYIPARAENGANDFPARDIEAVTYASRAVAPADSLATKNADVASLPGKNVADAPTFPQRKTECR